MNYEMAQSSEPDDTMCVKFQPLPKYYSASRELRNQAEKQRRDKLNHYVSLLSALVPFVANAEKKVDKTSVLRLSASYIRMNQILNRQADSRKKWKLSSLLDAKSCDILLKNVGGFFLVVTSSGRVVYVSEAVKETFGYCQADLLGQSFFSLIHADDVGLFKRNLTVQDNARRSFYCRMQEKALSRNDSGSYQIIHVAGQLKALPPQDPPPAATPPPPPPPCSMERETPTIRNSLRKRNATSKHGDQDDSDKDNDEEDFLDLTSPEGGVTRELDHDTHMLVALIQVVEPPVTNLTWVESTRDEYITRHKLDGVIEFADHRISFVLGLMPEEVKWTFAFMHMSRCDIYWSLLAFKEMMKNPQGEGCITSRLRRSDNRYIPLMSKGILEINKESGEVESYICVNRTLSEEEAEEQILEQKKRLVKDARNFDLDDLSPTLKKMIIDLDFREDEIRQIINNFDVIDSCDDQRVPRVEPVPPPPRTPSAARRGGVTIRELDPATQRLEYDNGPREVSHLQKQTVKRKCSQDHHRDSLSDERKQLRKRSPSHSPNSGFPSVLKQKPVTENAIPGSLPNGSAEQMSTKLPLPSETAYSSQPFIPSERRFQHGQSRSFEETYSEASFHCHIETAGGPTQNMHPGRYGSPKAPYHQYNALLTPSPPSLLMSPVLGNEENCAHSVNVAESFPLTSNGNDQSCRQFGAFSERDLNPGSISPHLPSSHERNFFQGMNASPNAVYQQMSSSPYSDSSLGIQEVPNQSSN